MYAGKRPKTQESESADFIHHTEGRTASFSHQLICSLNSRINDTKVDAVHAAGLCHSHVTLSLENLQSYEGAANKPAQLLPHSNALSLLSWSKTKQTESFLCTREKHYLPSSSRAVYYIQTFLKR